MINGMAAIRLFETVRHACRRRRSTMLLVGDVRPHHRVAQDEDTPFNPQNPYAAAKVYAHQMARIYRESYGMFIATGILFNHESERRPLHFVTQKIAYGAACAALGIGDSPDLNERGRPSSSNGRLALATSRWHGLGSCA